MAPIPVPGKQPEDDKIIWRYMDFYKFYSMVVENRFVFAEKKLFSDKLEGTYLRPVFNKIMEPLKSKDQKEFAKGLNNLPCFFLSEQMQPKYLYASCWHCSPDESSLMWSIYSSQNKGVAVKSTYSRLNKILPESDVNGNYHLGLIDYINPYDNSDASWIGNALRRIFIKHSAYSNESEVRAVFSSNEYRGDLYSLPIAPSEYIDEIIVSPFSDDLFFDLIKKIGNSMNVNVNRSSLACIGIESLKASFEKILHTVNKYSCESCKHNGYIREIKNNLLEVKLCHCISKNFDLTSNEIETILDGI